MSCQRKLLLLLLPQRFHFIHTVIDSLHGLKITLSDYTIWYFLIPGSLVTKEKESGGTRTKIGEIQVARGRVAEHLLQSCDTGFFSRALSVTTWLQAVR